MERTINTPEWEVGTDKQAAQWLGIEVQEWKKVGVEVVVFEYFWVVCEVVQCSRQGFS